jgi:hypothetical protein
MRSFWATLTRFDRTQLAPVMALRNALGVAVCLFTGLLLHNPAGGVMAAPGALDTAPEIRKIYGENTLRLLSDVEHVAKASH